MYGRQIGCLLNTSQPEGEYSFQVNTDHLALKPGIYLVKLNFNNKKMNIEHRTSNTELRTIQRSMLNVRCWTFNLLIEISS